MSTIIKDGTGNGYAAKVDVNNQLFVRSVNQSEFDQATLAGNAYNINTLNTSVSVGTETALLYLKNNDSRTLVIAAWFVGTGIQGAAPTSLPLFQVYTNPTGGTLLSGGTEINAVNRLVGSANELDADILAGDGSTSTVTGYDADPILYQTQGTSSRAFGSVQIALQRGASLAVTCTMNGAQTIDVYTGFQVYLV
jgi:Ca2+-binding RTX toxin-like protein